MKRRPHEESGREGTGGDETLFMTSTSTQSRQCPPIPPKFPVEQEHLLAEENRRLNDEVNRLLGERNVFILNLQNYEHQANQSHQQLQQLQQQLLQQHPQYSQQQKSYFWNRLDISGAYDSQNRRLKEAQEQVKMVEAAWRHCEMRLRHAEEREANAVRYLKNENFQVKEKLKHFETEIKRMQEKSIREMVDGRWGPPPDEIIRDRLNVLHRDIRDWAKRWAGGPIELDRPPSSEAECDFFQYYLPRFVRTAADGRLPINITKPNQKIIDKIPSLLLMAAVAYEIQTHFFERRFFCFEATRVEMLEEMHKELIDGL
jgi:hypothetical protein